MTEQGTNGAQRPNAPARRGRPDRRSGRVVGFAAALAVFRASHDLGSLGVTDEDFAGLRDRSSGDERTTGLS
jgi:hypothetical protein